MNPRPVMSADSSFTRIGLLSDVQWSPHADMGHSFHGTPRYYVDALFKAKRAVESFRSANCDLVIHLGDIVDYHAGLHERTEEAFERILDETLHTLDVPGTCTDRRYARPGSGARTPSHSSFALVRTPNFQCFIASAITGMSGVGCRMVDTAARLLSWCGTPFLLLTRSLAHSPRSRVLARPSVSTTSSGRS